MRMKCSKSRLADGKRFMAWRSELSAVVATADAIDKMAPKGVILSDEIRFENGEFLFHWEEARGGVAISEEQSGSIALAIEEELTKLQVRRQEANDRNQAITELPKEAKYVALNKAIFEAGAKELELSSGRPNSSPVRPVDPRSLVLRTPNPVAQDMLVDLVVTGSNVVGGDIQLLLFEESLVDVIYFVRGALFSQIRANVPIRLANVRNLVTHLRAQCSRARPDDIFVTATEFPFLYNVVNGEEVAYRDEYAKAKKS